MIFSLLIAALISNGWAQENSLDLRSPDQFEEAPNEPPFSNVMEADSALEDERSLEQEFEEPKRVPRWKQQRRRLPDESRIKELNKEQGLFKITKKNEYLYQVSKSPQKNAFSFRFGTLTLSNLSNETAGYNYEDIYGDGASMMMLIDWEWQFFKKLGKTALKIGSGVSVSQGGGKWERNSPNDLGSREPLENYSFYVFPNNVAVTYHADYFFKQIVVPYGEAGIDYYTFAESRDDGVLSYGGALAWHVAGGLQLSLNWINSETMVALDKENGINSIYLVAEYRIVTGLNEKFDFSDNIINGGFLIEY